MTPSTAWLSNAAAAARPGWAGCGFCARYPGECPVLVTAGSVLALGIARFLPRGVGLALRLAAAAGASFSCCPAGSCCPLGCPGISASRWPRPSPSASWLRSPASPLSSSWARRSWSPRRARSRRGCGARSRCWPAARRTRRRARGPAGRWVILGSLPLAGLVWWSAGPIGGDLLFHLARMRKLRAETLPVLGSVNEFQDGSLHPGYAFPLWHGAVALVARVAGADASMSPSTCRRSSSPLAAPAVRRRDGGVPAWAGGVAVVAAQVARSSRAAAAAGTGVFELLASPPTTAACCSRGVLALAFALVERGRGVSSCPCGRGLRARVIHPSYNPYVVILLGGFLVARLICRQGRPLVNEDSRRSPGVTVPFVLYLAWLFPVVADDPSSGRRRRVAPSRSSTTETRSTLRRLLPLRARGDRARRPGRRRRPPGDPARGLRCAPALGALVSAARSSDPARPAALHAALGLFSSRRRDASRPSSRSPSRSPGRSCSPGASAWPASRSPSAPGWPRSSSSAASSRTACRREGPAGSSGSRSSAAS